MIRNLPKQNFSQPRGFTLLEIAIAIGISSLILLGVYFFQLNVTRGTKVIQTSLTDERDVRRALASFVSELRQAQSASTGDYPIFLSGTSSVGFYSNIDSDAAVERVRYYIGTTTAASSTFLYRAILKPTGTPLAYTGVETRSVIVSDVSNGPLVNLFSYYDKNYDGTSAALPQPVSAVSVRLVKIFLNIDPNGARIAMPKSFTTQVTIRNVKDNL